MSLLSRPLVATMNWLAAPSVPDSLGVVRLDRWVQLVIIALALVLAVGLMVAWWITCQNKGLYPALDMPSWNAGGRWKAYCAR